MTHCAKCGRALKNPPINGMGPKCAKRAAPAYEGDLFGFDVGRASEAARVRLSLHIESRALDAVIAIRAAARAARVRLGVAR